MTLPNRFAVPPLYLTYLNALDVEALALSDDEILATIEASLSAQGRGETVIEPRMHLIPDKAVHGHFNVLRGAIRAPINLAGVKVISDYVDNYMQGLPSELGLLLLMDPTNGAPKAIVDGSHLTDMRTGAVTAIGAKYLARKESKVLGHVGARGTAYWNVRLLDRLFDFSEIRVHSRRRESRDAFAARLSRDLVQGGRGDGGLAKLRRAARTSSSKRRDSANQRRSSRPNGSSRAPSSRLTAR